MSRDLRLRDRLEAKLFYDWGSAVTLRFPKTIGRMVVNYNEVEPTRWHATRHAFLELKSFSVSVPAAQKHLNPSKARLGQAAVLGTPREELLRQAERGTSRPAVAFTVGQTAVVAGLLPETSINSDEVYAQVALRVGNEMHAAIGILDEQHRYFLPALMGTVRLTPPLPIDELRANNPNVPIL